MAEEKIHAGQFVDENEEEEGGDTQPLVPEPSQLVDTSRYQIRKLRDGDTYRVLGMASKVLGDENLRWAGTTGDQTMMMLAGAAALFEHAPRELQLFCADLIGIDGEEDRKRIKDEDAERQARQVSARRKWNQERTDAAAEGEEALAAFDRDNPEVVVYQLKSAKQIQTMVEDAIIARMEWYPPGTSQDIVAELMERDDFLPFVRSSMRVYEAGKTLSGRFSTLSSRLSDSQKPSS